MINKQNILFLKKYPIDTYNTDTLCKRFITKFYHKYNKDGDFIRFYKELNYLTICINSFIYFSKSLKNNK